MGDMADATLDFTEPDDDYDDIHTEDHKREREDWVISCFKDGLWPLNGIKAIPIEGMDIKHLRNTINWLLNHADYPCRDKYIEEMKSVLLHKSGDMISALEEQVEKLIKRLCTIAEDENSAFEQLSEYIAQRNQYRNRANKWKDQTQAFVDLIKAQIEWEEKIEQCEDCATACEIADSRGHYCSAHSLENSNLYEQRSSILVKVEEMKNDNYFRV